MDTANTDRTISHPKDTQDVSNIVMVRSWVIGDPKLPRRDEGSSVGMLSKHQQHCFCALCFLYKLVLGILHVFLLFCSMHLHAVSKGLPCGAIKLGNEPFPSIPKIFLDMFRWFANGFLATKTSIFSAAKFLVALFWQPELRRFAHWSRLAHWWVQRSSISTESRLAFQGATWKMAVLTCDRTEVVTSCGCE